MKSKPILFSAAMVRALLDDTKTQTRRIVKMKDGHLPDCSKPPLSTHECGSIYHFWFCGEIACPYGQPSDRLWVKETWRTDEFLNDFKPIDIDEDHSIKYEADHSATGIVAFGWGRIRQSIFMRKWMSRIDLEIVSVRVERLQDISETDAIAEGVETEIYAPDHIGVVGMPDAGKAHWKGYLNRSRAYLDTAKESYRSLWESINGPGSWDANPWVWVVEFRRVEE